MIAILLSLIPQAPAAQSAAIAVRTAGQDATPITRVVRAAGPSEMGQVYDVRDLLDALPPSFELATNGAGGAGVRSARDAWIAAVTQSLTPSAFPAARRGGAVGGRSELAELGYVGTAPVDDPIAQRRAKCQTLTRLVRGFIQPPLVDGRDDVVGYAEPGILLLKAPPEGHAWLNRFLTLRQRAPRVLEVKLWAIDAAMGQLARLGVGDDGRATLAADAVDAFLERASKGGANLVLAPKLVMYECATSSLSVMDEFTYVKEFRFVTVQPGNQTIADPVIEALPEGWSVELLAAEVATGEFGIDLYARQQIVQRPVRTQEIPLGNERTGTVSTPVGLTHELKTRFTLPLAVLPYTGDEWQDTAAPAQVFRLTTSVRDRELAVVVRVRAREMKPADATPPPATPAVR